MTKRRDFWRDLVYSLPPLNTHHYELTVDDHGITHRTLMVHPFVVNGRDEPPLKKRQERHA